MASDFNATSYLSVSVFVFYFQPPKKGGKDTKTPSKAPAKKKEGGGKAKKKVSRYLPPSFLNFSELIYNFDEHFRASRVQFVISVKWKEHLLL